MALVCCVLWTIVGPQDAQRPSVSISEFGKQITNFVTTTTLMYPGVEPKQVSAHVTLKELDCGMKILRLSIPIYIKNVLNQK